MVEFDGITEFVKSGTQRLRDAEELLQPPTLDPQEHGAKTRHLRGAVYLAGYGVECLLKACIISRQPNCKRLTEARDAFHQSGMAIRDICGVAGHDIRYLLSLTNLEAHMDEPKLRQMELCARSSSSQRYNPKPVHLDDAESRIEAARKLVDWIKSQI